MFKGIFNQGLDIQYLGYKGVFASCVEAVQFILQMNINIDEVKILTNRDVHCLLLIDEGESEFTCWAVRSGFSSGYSGEGPRSLSFVLWLFEEHDIHVDEYKVPANIINRIDNALISRKDIQEILLTSPVRPKRVYDYMYAYDKPQNMWRRFKPIVPYRIVDMRIIDLALTFWDDPDAKLVAGYRRLEDIVRARIGSNEHGESLFKEAFRDKDKYKLHWEDIHENERIGKANLFASVFAAHRNPRVHRKIKSDFEELLEEFLLLNHLYRLEAQAVEKEDIE